MPTTWRSPRRRTPRRFAALGNGMTLRNGIRRRAPGARRGFTLAEILLVLAVLVVIAAFAVPAIKGPLDNYRLRKSADTIRSAFASARAAAARTGMTHLFQYTPETGEYTIQPWTTGDEFLEINAGPTIDTAGPGAGTTTAAAPSLSPIKTAPLPDGILFHAVQTETSVRDMRTMSNTGDTASAMSSAATAAPPILFYSDGSSSNATVVLKNGRGAFVQIKLRGLTGHSTASKLLSGSQISGS